MYSGALLALIAVLSIVFVQASETGVAVDGWVSLPHGPPMPQLGLGTAGLFSDTQRVVSEGLKRGLYLVDSAQAQEWYDEAGAARALNALPADIPHRPLVVVKIHPRSFAFDAMEERLRDSEARILPVQADQDGLDVVLLHSPFCWQGHCNDEVSLFRYTRSNPISFLLFIFIIINIFLFCSYVATATWLERSLGKS